MFALLFLNHSKDIHKKAAVRQWIDSLPNKHERNVIRHRYKIDLEYKGKEELAKKYRLSISAIDRIECVAIHRLRNKERAKIIYKFLDALD